MAAGVWIEFLARPGALARAQTGLQSVPHPIRSIQRRSRRVRRYAEITRIVARNGLGPSLGLGPKDDIDGKRPPPVRRLRLALEECGGMFVKLGQILSTRTDLLPADAIRELSRLQDNVRPADGDAIRGAPRGRARPPRRRDVPRVDGSRSPRRRSGRCTGRELPDGSPVIVKVKRPGLDEQVEVDLSVLDELSKVIESRTSWGAEYQVRELVGEFSSRLREELDFRIEARNADTIAAGLPANSRIYVPQVHDSLTTSRVLVMEWLDGTSVRDVVWADGQASARKKLADYLLRTFLEQMLQDGVFHADPHPGNVMLLTDGRLALIDFGAAGRLDPGEQAAIRDLMAGVSRKDADMVANAVLQVGHLRRGVDINDFERALARFMAQHLAPGSKPDAAMFTAMLQLLFDYGVSLPVELSTFFRALIVLEGTLTAIAPGYSVIDGAEAFASQWVRARSRPERCNKPCATRSCARSRCCAGSRVTSTAPSRRSSVKVCACAWSHFNDEQDTRFVTRLVNRWCSRSSLARSACSRSGSSRSKAAPHSRVTPRSCGCSGTSGSSARPSSPCGSSSRSYATA